MLVTNDVTQRRSLAGAGNREREGGRRERTAKINLNLEHARAQNESLRT